MEPSALALKVCIGRRVCIDVRVCVLEAWQCKLLRPFGELLRGACSGHINNKTHSFTIALTSTYMEANSIVLPDSRTAIKHFDENVSEIPIYRYTYILTYIQTCPVNMLNNLTS